MGITKKEILSIPPRIKDIAKQRDRIEALREKLYSPRGLDTNEKVQSSGGESAALADIVIDMQQDLNEEQETLNDIRARAAEIIETLPDEQKYVMRLRYLDTDAAGEPIVHSWPEIAGVMFYSTPTTYRKHDEAMAILFPGEENEENRRESE